MKDELKLKEMWLQPGMVKRRFVSGKVFYLPSMSKKNKTDKLLLWSVIVCVWKKIRQKRSSL